MYQPTDLNRKKQYKNLKHLKGVKNIEEFIVQLVDMLMIKIQIMK